MRHIKVLTALLCVASTLALTQLVIKPGSVLNLSNTTLAQLRQNELNKLNAYRQNHGVPNVTITATLTAAAQAYADVLCNTMTFSHSSQAVAGQYGENLYKAVAYPSIKYEGNATKEWYDENANYNYTSGTAIDPTKMIGHFTAEIWDDVTDVGFGFCNRTQKYVYSPTITLDLAVLYVVANYYPTPNIIGQFVNHVQPPIDQSM